MNNQNDLALLELICQEVERLGLDLAPTYDAWVTVAYGLATDFGEAGREAFHRICRQYAKGYRREDTDRCYTYCLAHSRGQVHFGSVLLLAREAGVDTAGLRSALAAQRRAEGSGGTAGAAAGAGGGTATGAGVGGGAAGSVGTGFLQDCIAGAQGFSAGARVSNKVCGGSVGFGRPAAGGWGGGMVGDDGGGGGGGGDGGGGDADGLLLPGSEPLRPLPLLYRGSYAWPRLLAESVDPTDVPVYRDILLLGALTLIGAALGPSVQTRYSAKIVYPNLQTFVVAPAASGKGMLTFVRRLTDPLHQERRRIYNLERQKYNRLHAAWMDLGRKRTEVDEPEEPKNLMFYIPADNTGTGIVQNLCDNGGCGLLFEVEADTLSSAIQGDYGKFSDVLRKAFDHEGLSYNRRTNREYREVERTNLSVLISGTPAQVSPLIPSAENGLFSREVFYYMPAVREFRNQFDADDRELLTHYRQLGQRMRTWLGLLRTSGQYTVVLNDDQRTAFNLVFSRLFDRSVEVNNMEMNSWVVRHAIDTLRMLMVVAVLRATEPTYLEVERTGEAPRTLAYEPMLMEPTSGTNQAMRRRSIQSGYVVWVDEADFRQVLDMAEPLFEHALHILSMLQASEISRRTLSEQDKLFADLPEEFTAREAQLMATERGLNAGTVASWLSRWAKRGLVMMAGPRGSYSKRPAATPAARGEEDGGGGRMDRGGRVDGGGGGGK